MKYLIAISILAALGDERIASAQAIGGIEKTYELVNTILTVNEPVIVRYTVTNHLPIAVTNSRFFGYKLTRPDGRTANGPPIEWPDSFGPLPDLPLAPSETHSFLVLINKRFNFDSPGQYVLHITDLSVPPGSHRTEETDLPSVRLVIDVGPRDPVRLAQVCARLESAASAGYGNLDAAEALAYIGDPVAVPHIARVLSANQRFGWLLFPALGRIGNGAAAETLISYLASADEETRLIARGGLSRLLERTTDPAIKSRIKVFLPDR
jgi:hypothetical protein